MTVAVIEQDVFTKTIAPKVITSDAQNERYIAALLEMERRGHLTS